MRKVKNKVERGVWLLIAATVLIASALAAAWNMYVPDAPSTEHGHIQR
jgi:multidrug resistance efflux pump